MILANNKFHILLPFEMPLIPTIHITTVVLLQAAECHLFMRLIVAKFSFKIYIVI